MKNAMSQIDNLEAINRAIQEQREAKIRLPEQPYEKGFSEKKIKKLLKNGTKYAAVQSPTTKR